MNIDAIRNKLAGTASGPFRQAARIMRPLRTFLNADLLDGGLAPRSLLYVVIERGAVSVAHGNRFLGRSRLRGFRKFDLEDGPFPKPEALASLVERCATDFKAGDAGIILSVPKAWTIMRTAIFPATVRENLADAVSYELDRLTSLSPDKAYYDFSVLNDAGDKIEIILAAIKSDRIAGHLNALAEKGFCVETVTANCVLIEAFLKRAYGGDSFMYVETDGNEFEIDFLEKGAVTFAFGDKLPTADPASARSALLDAVVPAAAAFKERAPSSGIFFSADGVDPATWTEELPFSVEFVRPGDILTEVPGNPRAFSVAAAGAMIEAVSSPVRKLNLLRKGVAEHDGPPLRVTIVLAAVLLAAVILHFTIPILAEERKIAEIDYQIMLRKDELRKVEPFKKEADALLDAIRTVGDFKRDGALQLKVLREVTSVLPKTAWLSRVHVSGRTVELEGTARTQTADIIKSLQSSPLFKKVEVSIPPVKEGEVPANRFIIRMTLAEEKLSGD